MLEIHAVTTLTITADNKNAYLKGLFKPNAVESDPPDGDQL